MRSKTLVQLIAANLTTCRSHLRLWKKKDTKFIEGTVVVWDMETSNATISNEVYDNKLTICSELYLCCN